MASKKFSKDSKEFQFFGEFWKLAQKYYVPEESDEYWDNLIKDCSSLCNKYKDTFFLHMVSGLQIALEEVLKANRKDKQ